MLRFFNTLSRREEDLRPLNPGRIGLYTCGPTVYDFAHIGNFRAYVWEDLLRRTLEFSGLEVLHVMNLTDVDDKTIRGALERGVSLDEYTQPYIDGFFEDARALNLLPAHHYPRATRHVPEMLDLVRRLRDRGHTYESRGSVYFRIASFPAYGRLSGLQPDALRSAAAEEGIDSDEYEKEDVRDFVLWKARRPGEPHWSGPFGDGRPGWHLECSAMSMKYLGESFDIHTGAVDNIFPHHENEIAQSEAATGRPFVRLWMHCAHLIVDGEKMSKSKGNYYTLRDLLRRGADPRAIRYLLLSVHYRKPLNFTLEGLEQASASLARLDDFVLRLRQHVLPPGRDEALSALTQAAAAAFRGALEDDLNSSAALAALFDLVRDTHAAFDAGRGGQRNRDEILELLADAERVLGVLRLEGPFREEIDLGGRPQVAHYAAGDPGPQVRRLVRERLEARRARDFARADALRDELGRRGFVVEDIPGGCRVKRG
jgi:cysteinyl-tRNA synthetase